MNNYILALISNYCIFAYILILFVERTQSLVRTFLNDKKAAFSDGFDVYANCLALLSLIGTLVVLFAFNFDFLHTIFCPSVENFEAMDFKWLCILIGTVLLSGMVHTKYTINGVQFASYGILIVALILYTVMNQARTENVLLLWLSLVYLVCFSMAIPVVYKSQIKYKVLFHVIEAVVSVAMVAFFSFLTYLVFVGCGTNLFILFPLLLAITGDLLILILRWKEEINFFVLIFLIATVVLWIVGKIVQCITGFAGGC